MPTCTGACQAVISAIDECPLKTALQTFVASIFLELPEDPPSKYWNSAVRLMEQYQHSAEWPQAMAAWNGYIEGR